MILCRVRSGRPGNRLGRRGVSRKDDDISPAETVPEDIESLLGRKELTHGAKIAFVAQLIRIVLEEPKQIAYSKEDTQRVLRSPGCSRAMRQVPQRTRNRQAGLHRQAHPSDRLHAR